MKGRGRRGGGEGETRKGRGRMGGGEGETCIIGISIWWSYQPTPGIP